MPGKNDEKALAAGTLSLKALTDGLGMDTLLDEIDSKEVNVNAVHKIKQKGKEL
jgi:hypothetical protein